MKNALQQLDEIARLEHDWDSYGAHAIDPRSVEMARQFLVAYPEAQEGVNVIPTNEGCVDLEWGGDSIYGTDLDIWLLADGNIEWLKWIGGDSAKQPPYEPEWTELGDESFSLERCYELFCWWREASKKHADH